VVTSNTGHGSATRHRREPRRPTASPWAMGQPRGERAPSRRSGADAAPDAAEYRRADWSFCVFSDRRLTNRGLRSVWAMAEASSSAGRYCWPMSATGTVAFIAGA